MSSTTYRARELAVYNHHRFRKPIRGQYLVSDFKMVLEMLATCWQNA
jgi:hypothetical protein